MYFKLACIFQGFSIFGAVWCEGEVQHVPRWALSQRHRSDELSGVSGATVSLSQPGQWRAAGLWQAVHLHWWKTKGTVTGPVFTFACTFKLTPKHCPYQEVAGWVVYNICDVCTCTCTYRHYACRDVTKNLCNVNVTVGRVRGDPWWKLLDETLTHVWNTYRIEGNFWMVQNLA